MTFMTFNAYGVQSYGVQSEIGKKEGH